jgi:hypothetical protein
MEEPDAWTNLALRCLTAAITLSVLGPGNAQTPTAPQGAAPQAYRPGLGDLMTMTVQPRHTKLGLAGQEKNWTYAAYELHELEEAFERAARVWRSTERPTSLNLLWQPPKSRWKPWPRPSRAPMLRSSSRPMAGSPRPATRAIRAPNAPLSSYRRRKPRPFRIRISGRQSLEGRSSVVLSRDRRRSPALTPGEHSDDHAHS